MTASVVDPAIAAIIEDPCAPRGVPTSVPVRALAGETLAIRTSGSRSQPSETTQRSSNLAELALGDKSARDRRLVRPFGVVVSP